MDPSPSWSSPTADTMPWITTGATLSHLVASERQHQQRQAPRSQRLIQRVLAPMGDKGTHSRVRQDRGLGHPGAHQPGGRLLQALAPLLLLLLKLLLLLPLLMRGRGRPSA